MHFKIPTQELLFKADLARETYQNRNNSPGKEMHPNSTMNTTLDDLI